MLFIALFLTSVMFTSIIAADCEQNSPPNQPDNPHPISGYYETSLDTTITWSCTDPDNDDLVYDIYFGSELPLKKQVRKQENTTYRPQIRYNTHYYWMIVAYDPCGDIAISKLWDFYTMENPTPHPPIIQSITPINNAMNISTSTELSVNVYDQDDDRLTVKFYTRNDMILDTINCDNGETISTNWNNLEKNTQYQWYITVSDNEYNIQSELFTFTTTSFNIPPVAIISSEQNGLPDQNIIFDASSSYDPDGIVTSYRWDWNNDETWDTSWSTFPFSQHQFSQIGKHTIVLQAKDNQGLTNITTVQITIADTLTASFTYTPTQPEINQQITFDASSSIDPNGSVLSYRWDFTNDEIFSNWTTDPLFQKTFQSNGSYSITLEIKNQQQETDQLTRIIQIGENLPPSSPLKPNGAQYPTMNTSYFYSTSSIDPENNSIRYGWDWNNDSIVDNWSDYFPSNTIHQTSITWTELGVKHIKVKAEDEKGVQSNWSEPFIINISSLNIQSPIPEHNQTNVIISITLQWETNTDHQLQYDVYLAEQQKPLQLIAKNITDTKYKPETLLSFNKSYEWKVIAWDQIGRPTESSQWKFSTKSNSIPNTPTNPSPKNNQRDVLNPVTLTWQCNDEDPSDSLNYDIYFGNTKDSLFKIHSNHTSTSYKISDDLTQKQTYYWKIVVRDEHGYTNTSTIWSFIMQGKSPNAECTYNGHQVPNSAITFDASKSTCFACPIRSYSWDFGDGKTSNGKTVTHTYTEPRSYSVKLTVEDSSGQTANKRFSIVIKDEDIGGPYDITCSPTVGHWPFFGSMKNNEVTFSIKAKDPDGDRIRFYITWGDNTSQTRTEFVNNNQEVTVTHIWKEAGEYTYTIIAEDENEMKNEPVENFESKIRIRDTLLLTFFILVGVGGIIISVETIIVIIGRKKEFLSE